MIWVPAQLVGAYHGDTVSLTCFVEAHPASLNYWEKDGVMIHANDHYDYTQERGSPAYKVRRWDPKILHITIEFVSRSK